MKENRVKRILLEGGLALGTHVGGIADPQIVKIIGLAGCDAACVDMAGVARIDEIAAVEGVDLLAVGPSDLSRSLGVSGQPDHPRLVAAIDRVRGAVKNGAGARLTLPLNHAAFPRNAAQLRDLGAGYTNCAPTPEARLLHSLQTQLSEARKLLG